MSDFVVTINNETKSIRLAENGTVIINKKKYDYEFHPKFGNLFILKLNDRIFEIAAEKINEEKFILNIEGETIETVVRTALQEKAKKMLEKSAVSHSKMEIKAPMPGMILKIKKEAEEKVESGEAVIILEAMKMENEIRAPKSGTVNKIFVKEGSAVEKGMNLFVIE